MVAKKASVSLPKESIFKLLVCAGIVVAFVALLILPNIMEDKETQHEILKKKAEIERQKVLFPLYIKLQAQLNNKVVKELPIPEAAALTEDQIDAATHTIEDIAVESDLRINEVTPDPASLSATAGYVGVNCDFYGPFLNFRTFLMKLGAVPYLKHVEKIEMQEGVDGVNYIVRLQLAVKTDTGA